MTSNKELPDKRKLRLNKPITAAVCSKCGHRFPYEGIFSCLCGIAHQCKRVGGVIHAVPLAVEEGLIKL